MRKGVQVKSDKGFRYAIKCRVCLDKWVEDVPVGTLADVLGEHDCAGMAEAKRNNYRRIDEGWHDYRMLVFEVAEVMWNEDPKGYHPCGPKCESAKGASCHCECRGLKHGIANMPKDDPTPDARCTVCGHDKDMYPACDCGRCICGKPIPRKQEVEVDELFRRLGPEGRSDMWAEMHDRKSRRIGKNGI